MPYPTPRAARRPRRTFTLLAAACLSAMALGAKAQVVMAGSYQNFDVLNSTGAPTHGFEMEVWGGSARRS